jgi:hypothetical protein
MLSVSKSEILAKAPEDSFSLVEDIVEQLFDSLMWTSVSEGIVEKVSPLNTWKHRTLADIEADFAYLEINRQAALSSLSKYLANESIATKELDWLFLNVLTYAEYIGTVSEIRRKMLGVEEYVKRLSAPKPEHSTDISLFAKKAWHLPLAISIVSISWFIHPAMPVLVTIYMVYANHKKKKGFEKINKILASMLSAYSSFNTVDLSWKNVGEMLEKSRDAGAIWDGSIFALVERRKALVHA